MKYVTLVFVIILGVVAPVTRATIGDTEQQVLVSHLGQKIDRSTIDEKAKVIVFTTKDEQYAVGILDGRVESEVFTKNDDSKLDESFVIGTLRSYKEVWFPVDCSPHCAAAMSGDGSFLAKIGEAKDIHKKNAFWVFTDAWRRYAQSKHVTPQITL